MWKRPPRSDKVVRSNPLGVNAFPPTVQKHSVESKYVRDTEQRFRDRATTMNGGVSVVLVQAQVNKKDSVRKSTPYCLIESCSERLWGGLISYIVQTQSWNTVAPLGNAAGVPMHGCKNSRAHTPSMPITPSMGTHNPPYLRWTTISISCAHMTDRASAGVT